MKKVLKLLALILLIYLLSTAISNAVYVRTDESRGVPTEISYSPDSGPPPANNVWFSDLISRTSWLCAQHPGAFFSRVDPSVTLSYSTPGGAASRTITSITPTSGSFVVWSGDRATIPTTNVRLVANSFSGQNKATVSGQIGPTSSGWGQAVTIYTTGNTKLTERETVSGKNAENSALAYVLSECNYNIGVPDSSYVNVAFWQAKETPDATSGNIGVQYFQPNDMPLSPNETNDTLNNIANEIQGLRQQIEAAQSQISILKDDIQAQNEYILAQQEEIDRYLGLGYEESGYTIQRLRQNIAEASSKIQNDNVQISNYQTQIANFNNQIAQKQSSLSAQQVQTITAFQGVHSQATSLWEEATDFGAMWDKIEEAGGYGNTIIDGTNIDNVKVMWDGDRNIYEVGPFAINYLECYTGETQLCGMSGLPTLTVRKDGADTTLEFDEDINSADCEWTIKYADGRTDAPGIPSKYNLYPHSGEQFYIQIKFQEGIEKISGLKFSFRYLEAEGSYTRYQNDIEVLKWNANVQYGTGVCNGADPCFYGEIHNDLRDHRMGVDSDGDGEEDIITCDGRSCPHGELDPHPIYTSATVTYNVSIASRVIDIQDIGYCQGAQRNYAGSPYGERKGTDGPGDDPTGGNQGTNQGTNQGPNQGQHAGTNPDTDENSEKEFNWDIDLTTSIAGNVWREIDAQKVGGHINGLKDEDGMINVAVTVYLYNGNSKLKEAIAHDENGVRKQWPIYTEADGYWHVDKIEAPATNSQSNCFYVVEFQYDGQLLRHTVFLGNPNNNSNSVAAESDINAYMLNPDTYRGSSMAVEDQDERYKFDAKFGEITGEESIDDNGNTKGIAYRTDNTGYGRTFPTELNYVSGSNEEQEHVTISKLDSAASEARTGQVEKVIGENFAETEYTIYRMRASTFYNDTSLHGDAPNPASYRLEYPLRRDGSWVWQLNKYKNGTMNYIDEYMLHINLGLKERPHVDMSVLKDLYKITIVLNEQKITKQFNYLKDMPPEYEIAFEQLYEKRTASDGSEKYALGLYNSDLSYQSYKRYKNAIKDVYNIKKDSELRVYATYAIRIYNNSETNVVELNEIKDYYDNSYTLVQEQNGFYNLDDNDKYLWHENQVKTSLVDEKMHRDMQVVADAPYYRIMSVNTGASNCVWEESKSKNLGADGTIEAGHIFIWTDDGEENGQKVIKTDFFTEKKLDVNQYLELFTTYEIDKQGYDATRQEDSESLSNDQIKELRSQLTKAQDKDNIAEISSYSTYYGAEDGVGYYAKYTGFPQTTTPSGVSYGWVSGKVDRDSAPNNIYRSNVKDRSKHEDDTDRCVPLKVSVIVEELERTMTGVVWDDEKTVDVDFQTKVADGYFSSEKGIAGVEVSMYEVINLGKLQPDGSYNTDYDNYDYYYRVPNEFYNNGSGMIQTDDNGRYTLKGFLPGDYILRFDYGKNTDQNYDFEKLEEVDGEPFNIYKYNGQDYENSKFMAGYNEAQMLNTKFLDLTGKEVQLDNFSVARDNESRRLVVDSYSRTIENDRAEILRNRNEDEFRDATRMFAETPVMQVEIRDPKNVKKLGDENDKTGKYVEKIEEFAYQILNSEYTIEGINFGLEKRAETDIEIEEFITRIVLLKEGSPIFRAELDYDGELIRTDEQARGLDKIVYVPHSKATDKSIGLYQQGFFSVEVEDEYMNDLILAIRYKQVITNKSEVDFTGKLANRHVASDIVKLSSKTPTDYYTNALTNDLTDYKADEIDNEIGTSTNNTLADLLISKDDWIKALIQEDEARIQTDENQEGEKIFGGDTIRPQIIVYGRYVGRYYYENKINEEEAKETYAINNYAGTGTDAYLEEVKVDYAEDKIVRTTVDKLVNYVDIDGKCATDSLAVNGYWEEIQFEKDQDGYYTQMNGLISKEGIQDEDGNDLDAGAYRKAEGEFAADGYDIYDEKDRKFITETRSNIIFSTNENLQPFEKYRNRENEQTIPEQYQTYLDKNQKTNEENYKNTGRLEYKNDDIVSIYNNQITKELLPEHYFDEKYPDLADPTNLEKREEAELAEESKYSRMYMTAIKEGASDIEMDQMKLDNLVEVLVYSNAVGKRDKDSVPGNAIKIATRDGMWPAGYNSYDQNKTYTPTWKAPEDDAWSPEYVTIIPPTGLPLRQYIINYTIPTITMAVALLTLLIIFTNKQIHIHKKYKD